MRNGLGNRPASLAVAALRRRFPISAAAENTPASVACHALKTEPTQVPRKSEVAGACAQAKANYQEFKNFVI